MVVYNVPSDYIVTLDPWTRLGIISGCALFFIILILILVCSLSPFCPLYACCPFNKRFLKKDQTNHLHSNYGTLNVKTNNRKKILKPYAMDIQKEVESSDWSDCNFGDHMELSITKVEKRDLKLPPDSDGGGSCQETSMTNEGHLCFKLRYEKDEAKLTIKVIKANDLPLFMHNQMPVDNYVRIRLYRIQRSFLNFGRSRPSRSFPLNTLDLEVQTKIQRKTRSPVFNEKFDIYVDQKHLKDYIMRLQLCDFDHFSCHTVRGDIILRLQDVQILHGEDKIFDQQLSEHIPDMLGEIYVCLTHLPTSEKLCLKIARTLSLPMMNKDSKCTDAYVRISLMCDGRQMKKAKTAVRDATVNPVFNESFIFDVPTDQLQNIYFIISVLHLYKVGEKSGYLIGRVYLGPKFDFKSKIHWQEMIKNSRKEIGAWHKIKG